MDPQPLATPTEVATADRAIGQRIGAGPARVLRSLDQMAQFQPGEVLVADMTDPDWEPIMKRASAIMTNRAGAPATPRSSRASSRGRRAVRAP